MPVPDWPITIFWQFSLMYKHHFNHSVFLIRKWSHSSSVLRPSFQPIGTWGKLSPYNDFWCRGPLFFSIHVDHYLTLSLPKLNLTKPRRLLNPELSNGQSKVWPPPCCCWKKIMFLQIWYFDIWSEKHGSEWVNNQTIHPSYMSN